MLVRQALVLSMAIVGVLAGQPSAKAQSLTEALAAAYQNNPQLSAQRARLRATDEQVPQALSGFRPTIQAFSEIGPRWADSNNESLVGSEDGQLFSRTVGGSIEQPLYKGGQTAAALRGAENVVRAERARLTASEQDVLLKAATAYSDVYRDQAVLELTIRNEQRLARQLEATRDRFQVGEVTRTDVSQAEARLARATAERIASEGNLAASRATFRNVVGTAPALLARPPLPEGIPANLSEANALATDWNPTVSSAEFEQRSAFDSIDKVRGEMLPQVSLVGRVQRGYEEARSGARYDSAEAIVNVTIPLYQAGSVYSRLREAKQTAAQRRRELDQSQNDAVETSTRSWNALETATAEIGSYAKQVQANRFALEGVEREAEVGARTVLDVLDAQQELVESQVSLVRAERDRVVAAFQLKSALGQLTARQLNLPVQYYDPEEHYRQVRDAWFGGSSSGDISGNFASSRDREE